MLKVGLTGGIGSGKTTVGKVFSALDVPVYSADNKARDLMEMDPKLISAISSEFGSYIYENGRINRQMLGEIVFKDKARLEKLNAIVHPAVHEDFKRWSEEYSSKSYVIEEAAILIESGGIKNMDFTIFIKADMESRIVRVMKRDQLSRELVIRRIQNQMEDSEKEKLVDFIIYNENDSMILPQIVDLHNKLLKIKS
jgi:dephospho-CoA kinase